MKLKTLKRMLNEMSDEQLEKELVVMACDKTLSGIGEARKAKAALYYDFEDDPCSLKTMSDLKDNYDDVRDVYFECVIKRGNFYIELP